MKNYDDTFYTSRIKSTGHRSYTMYLFLSSFFLLLIVKTKSTFEKFCSADRTKKRNKSFHIKRLMLKLLPIECEKFIEL